MILLKAVDLTTNLNHLFGQFADLRGGGGGGAWQERGGGVFEGGWYTNAHYDLLL